MCVTTNAVEIENARCKKLGIRSKSLCDIPPAIMNLVDSVIVGEHSAMCRLIGVEAFKQWEKSEEAQALKNRNKWDRSKLCDEFLENNERFLANTRTVEKGVLTGFAQKLFDREKHYAEGYIVHHPTNGLASLEAFAAAGSHVVKVRGDVAHHRQWHSTSLTLVEPPTYPQWTCDQGCDFNERYKIVCRHCIGGAQHYGMLRSNNIAAFKRASSSRPNYFP